MKLIQEIINELINSELSITSPLLKTKVLASRLQNFELLNWVTNELKGYNNKDHLPQYRKYKGIILGTYIIGTTQYHKQPVPTKGFDKNFEDMLYSMYFFESISGLENKKSQNNDGVLEQFFPAEIVGLIQKNWRDKGNPYLRLINCSVIIDVTVIDDILSIVRSNLLDFMLKIDAEFGSITEIEELNTKKTEIATIMSQTIFNVTGDGNVLNTGDNAKLNVAKGEKVSQTINVEAQQELTKFIEELKLKLDELSLDTDDKTDIINEISRIETQLLRQQPKYPIINEALKIVNGILIGVAGNAMTPHILQRLSWLMSQFQ